MDMFFYQYISKTSGATFQESTLIQGKKKKDLCLFETQTPINH